jgi:hypothetical protein
MRWKLLRRRLSVSAPRMIVRSRLPWPLRWAALAIMFGFSAALALWAFEFGKQFAGLDRGAKEELATLHVELTRLRAEHERARHVADTAESLLKAERTAQEKLALQLRQVEADKLTLQSELGFFQKLLPTGAEGIQLRGLQAEAKAPGELRYQMLVVQNGKDSTEFNGRYEMQLAGLLDGKAWAQTLPGGPRPLLVKQVARVEGLVEHPAAAVIKTVQVRVLDARGVTRATHTTRL